MSPVCTLLSLRSSGLEERVMHIWLELRQVDWHVPTHAQGDSWSQMKQDRKTRMTEPQLLPSALRDLKMLNQNLVFQLKIKAYLSKEEDKPLTMR